MILGETAAAIRMSELLLDEGVFVTGFGYPVVPQGQARVRCQISAAHTRDDLDQALAAFKKVGREARADIAPRSSRLPLSLSGTPTCHPTGASLALPQRLITQPLARQSFRRDLHRAPSQLPAVCSGSRQFAGRHAANPYGGSTMNVSRSLRRRGADRYAWRAQLAAQAPVQGDFQWYLGGHGGVLIFRTPAQTRDGVSTAGGHTMITASRTGLLLSVEQGVRRTTRSSAYFNGTGTGRSDRHLQRHPEVLRRAPRVPHPHRRCNRSSAWASASCTR